MPVMWGRLDHWRRTSVRLIRDKPTKLLLFWSSLPALFATLTLPAYADFSYVRTTKSSADTSVQTTRQFLKGQKLRMEHGNVASVVDLAAGTITTIDSRRKLYTVHKLAEKREIARMPASQSQTKADVRESGNKKKIGGYSAKEVVLTMDGGTSPITGNRMQMEADIWLASGVPGGRELQAFQRKGNAMNPDPASGGSLEKTLADLQQRTAGLDGLPLLQIMKIRTSKDGPAVLEITMTTGGFSTAPLPDSLFAVPAGFRKAGAPKK